MDLIDREELRERSMPVREFMRNNPDLHVVSVNQINKMPTVYGHHSFDIDANVILDATFGKDQPIFREMDEMCPRCQRDLEVYYCENRTYAVRCKHCKMVTIVSAGNPYEAAEKVGLHAKPARHGRWMKIQRPGSRCWCSECKSAATFGTEHNYCPNCGAKMDAEVQGEKH